MATWDGETLEQAMFESGTVGVMHRTTEEWLAHPEGAYLANTDLIEIRKIAEGDPVPWTPDPTQPLTGIKALTLTHVIAGSVAARTPSEYGSQKPMPSPSTSSSRIGAPSAPNGRRS